MPAIRSGKASYDKHLKSDAPYEQRLSDTFCLRRNVMLKIMCEKLLFENVERQ